MKRIRRCREFTRAMVRGAVLHYRMGAPLGALAVLVLRSLLAPAPMLAPLRVRLARARGCRDCPLYDPRMRTCGDGVSLMEHQGRLVAAGCQCWLPLKVSLVNARCFLEELGLPSRWPRHDRPVQTPPKPTP